MSLSTARRNNFAKAAKWSPDGSVAIAVHDDEIIRMYQVPFDEDLSGSANGFSPYASTAEGGPILDYCFFPSFTWEYPATCCFITSSQDHPIHLRDALTGELRNTYRPFNHVDERPGRQVEDWLLSTKKGKGQKGIIGAVASSNAAPGLYAAGSYNKNICLYEEGTRGKAVGRLALKETGEEMGGVTQLAFARINVKLGIPDHWLVLGLSICEQMISEWQWMPQVVLLAALCPPGMEATMLALLAGCHNLGGTVGSHFGAMLLHFWDVKPRGQQGDAAQFDNLWIVAATTSILPLFTAMFFRYLLPDCKQNEKIPGVSDPTENSILKRWLNS